MKFGIIGFGRFGKLWGEKLTQYGEVLVFDKRKIKIENKNIKKVNLLKVLQVDFLFLTVPISEFENIIKEIKNLVSKETLIIDTCSVKLYPINLMKSNFSIQQSVLGTHPLFGPDSVKNGNFKNHKIVVCPLKNDNKTNLMIKLFKKIGLKVIITTPQNHDKQMANSQALVHFIGRGLENLNLKKQIISTPDYNTLLKMNQMVKNDSCQLFFDMQKFNPYTKKNRIELIKNLIKIEKIICPKRENLKSPTG